MIRLYRKMLLVANTTASSQKCAWPYFHVVANKRLNYTVITASRINLFAAAIFLHGKLCSMYMVYFERIGNGIEKHTFNTALQHNKFFDKRMWIIRCFHTHYQLSKFTLRGMPFKQDLPHYTRGLTDCASLKNQMMTRSCDVFFDLRLNKRLSKQS